MAAAPALDAPEQVLSEALSLPAGDRLQIAAELLASVEDPGPGLSDEAWLAEVQSRAERAHRGETRGEPWADVKREVLARIRRR